MAPSQWRRENFRGPSANTTMPLLLLLPSLLLLVCLPSPLHALDFQDIRDGFSGASDDIRKGMNGLRLPGMCAYYDPIEDRCHVNSNNGVRTEVAGRCGDNMKDIIPTCRGHPDAYMPQPQVPTTPAKPLPVPPKTPVEVKPDGEIPGSPTPLLPPPPQKPTSERPVRAPTGKQGTQNPPRWPPLSGKDSGEPVADVVEEEKERRRRGLKGFALFGVLIGTAICVAILSVLGVGYYAYRTRQKTMRLREQVLTAREARAHVTFAGISPSLPSVPTPRSLGL
ncbi:hypothetical protein VYU27_006912 [Nannochloropsis oceanica]